MTVRIEYGPDWIGVPAFGEGHLFGTPAAWAQALADEILAEGAAEADAGQRAALVSALTVVGDDAQRRDDIARYVFYPAVGAAMEVVDAVLLDRSVIGDAGRAEVGGADESDLLRPATVTEFATASGLAASLVVRHAPFDDRSDGIVMLRASVVVDVGDGMLVLGTATTDLAAFEAFRPHLIALADTVV